MHMMNSIHITSMLPAMHSKMRGWKRNDIQEDPNKCLPGMKSIMEALEWLVLSAEENTADETLMPHLYSLLSLLTLYCLCSWSLGIWSICQLHILTEIGWMGRGCTWSYPWVCTFPGDMELQEKTKQWSPIGNDYFWFSIHLHLGFHEWQCTDTWLLYPPKAHKRSRNHVNMC